MIFTVGWVRQKRARGLNGDKEPSGWGSAEDIEQREYIYVYVHTYILKSCVCCTASCCSTHKRYISREGGDGGYRIQLILTRQPPKNPKAAATMTTGPHNRWQTHRKEKSRVDKRCNNHVKCVVLLTWIKWRVSSVMVATLIVHIQGRGGLSLPCWSLKQK